MNMGLGGVGELGGVRGKGFDGGGKYWVGVKEELILGEMEYDKMEKIDGMNIIIVSRGKSDEEGRGVVKLMGMGFSG